MTGAGKRFLPAALLNGPLGMMAQSQSPLAVGRGCRPAAKGIGLGPVASLVIFIPPREQPLRNASQLTGAR